MARYYKGKRIGADVYTIGKFGKGLRETLDTENPLLYSDGRYPTKLSSEDLPEDYIAFCSRVIWYMNGYIRTSGIIDMKYRWVKENHLFKDDYSYSSFPKRFHCSYIIGEEADKGKEPIDSLPLFCEMEPSKPAPNKEPQSSTPIKVDPN